MLNILVVVGKVLLFLSCFLFFHFFISQSLFWPTFSCDVDFGYGQKKWKNRKNNKDFWGKLFYLDVKKYIKKWHYAFFWINNALAVPLCVDLLLYEVFDFRINHWVTVCLIMAYLISAWVPSSSYSELLRRDVVRSKKEYRKNRQKYR